MSSREYMREYMRNYRKKDSYKKYHSARIGRWMKNNKEKSLAYSMVQHALKSGKLIRPDVCENCDIKTFVFGHHEDYKKFLDVNWLCDSCHKQLHRERGVVHA